MKNILLILIILGFSNTVSAQESTQEVIRMQMLKLRVALLNKDSISLDHLLSEDVTYGHTNGMIQTRAELIRSVMSGEQDYQQIEPSDLMIRIYDHAAVVNMEAHVVMHYRGSPLDMKMKITLTWIKQDTKWKLVARQSVAIK